MNFQVPRNDAGRSPSRSAAMPMELTGEEWARRALRARSEGAFDLAAQCCREAIRRAPMNEMYRRLFTEVLYERLEQPNRGATRVATPAPQQHMEEPRWESQQEEQEEFSLPSAHQVRAARSVAPPARQQSRIPVPAPRSFASAPLFPTEEVEDEMDYEEAPTPRRAAARVQPVPAARQRPRMEGGRNYRPVVVSLIAALVLGGSVFAVQAIGGRGSSTPDIPEALQARLTEANNSLTSGNEAKAVETLRDAAEAFPTQVSTINRSLAIALEGAASRASTRKEWTTASKHLEEATTLDPTNTRLWERLGAANRELAKGTKDTTKRRKLLDTSESAYRRVLANEDEHPGAMLGLAQVYQARNDREKAIDMFEAVVRDAPKSPEAKTAESSLGTLKKK